VTGGKARIGFFLKQHDPSLLASSGSDDLIADLHKHKTAFYVEAMQAGKVPLRPGVAALLRQARDEGLTLAIATTTTPVNFQSLIESTLGPSALDWFAVIGAGDCVENLKPAPDIYLWVLDRLNFDAANCLAFEDSANGRKAARAARLATVITHCSYTKDHDFTGALRVLDSLADVDVEMLRRLHR
jgi:beta-phosphoglucomutase-like phosphatase (HAD superfamily)